MLLSAAGFLHCFTVFLHCFQRWSNVAAAEVEVDCCSSWLPVPPPTGNECTKSGSAFISGGRREPGDAV